MRAVVLRQRAQEVQGLLRGWWACACTATTLGDDAAVQQLLEPVLLPLHAALQSRSSTALPHQMIFVLAVIST